LRYSLNTDSKLFGNLFGIVKDMERDVEPKP